MVDVVTDRGLMVTVTSPRIEKSQMAEPIPGGTDKSTFIFGEGSVVNGMAEGVQDWQKTQVEPPIVSHEVRPTIKI